MNPAAEKVAEVLDELTAGWKTCQIQEVAEVNPRIDKKAIPDDIEVSFVPMPAVEAESGEIDVSQTKLAKEVKKGFTTFLQGDVLFAKITPCMENGKMAIAPALVNDYGFGSTEFHVLRPHDDIEAKYLYYYVSSKSFRGEAERFMTGAVGQKRVPTTYIKSATIPVAPIENQRCIVAEIEKQFSRLDEAVASLKRVKANLKRYKAAVLKAAVEGKLTEEWRKRNPDVEPASKLLERIWLDEEQTESSIDPQPEKFASALPNGWAYVPLDSLMQYTTSGSRGWAKYYSEDGDIFIRAQNINQDVLNLSDVAYVSLPENAEGKRTRVRVGDILITITGANVTKSALVSKEIDGDSYISQHVALVRPLSIEFAKYLYLFVVCPSHGRRQLEKAAYGAGKPGLNLTNIRELGVAFPSLEEQRAILDEVATKLSTLQELENQIDENILRSRRLRSSVLSQAFTAGIEY